MDGTNDERLVLTVSETAEKLGLSRGLTYEAIRLGQIPSIRIGRRILVPCAALKQLLNGGLSSQHIDGDKSRVIRFGERL
jgi:excisionase family DNA binding protein